MKKAQISPIIFLLTFLVLFFMISTSVLVGLIIYEEPGDQNSLNDIIDEQELPVYDSDLTLTNLNDENINPLSTTSDSESKTKDLEPNTLSVPESTQTPDSEPIIPDIIPDQDPPSESNLYLVTRVIDGDTIEIKTGERVRLVCIDTPESGEYYYKEAKDYLNSLVLDKEVILEQDISETDRYDRLLRYIYLEDGTFVNEMIVKEGYAQAYQYKPDVTLCPIIEDAEDYAQERELGIWAKEEEEEVPEDYDYECGSNFYNCGDFNSQSEAQIVFDVCGGVGNDIHRLDGDNDGVACESI